MHHGAYSKVFKVNFVNYIMPRKVKRNVSNKAKVSSPRKEKVEKTDDSKVFAFLAVLLGIIGFLIAYFVKKEDKYVMFYAKQSLVLFIGFIIAGIVAVIPFIGFIGWIADIVLVIFWIIGMVYAFSGEQKNIPIIGDIAKNFNF
jgi:uncharacterized membrane protein